MPPERFKIIVLGGGAGGLVVAAGAALFGARVALIEKRAMLGGDCLNFGCVPSKAFVRAAKAAHELKTADRFGLPRQAFKANLPAVMAYVHQAIATISVHDDAERFRAMGVDVITEVSPRLLGRGRVQVGARVLEADHIVIATGSRPAAPAITGLQDGEWFDNESVWHALAALPDRLVVVGGGPIGCELGQAFGRLGSHVTVVQFAPRLLEKEEPEASDAVARALTDEGLAIRLGTSAVRAETRDGRRVLVLKAGDVEEAIPFDAILVATGRRPNVEGLDLAAAGVALDARGFVAVDAAMRTSGPGVFAVGDVSGGLLFTHVAEAEAKVALRNALFPFTGKMDYRVVPWATFTDPEVARVGADEASLRAAGQPFSPQVFPFADADRAVTDGATRGFVKVLADRRGKILGATIVGGQAGELIHEFALAMRQGATLADLSGLIHAYPTLSLANRRASDAYMKGKLDGPGGRILRWWASRGGS